MSCSDRVTHLVTITGRVQRVGYRDWMVAQAATLGIAGWVRNRPEGNVEALVHGDAAAIAVYGETDLLCYWADSPQTLAARQAKAWQPWLDWARTDLGAALTVTAGVMHVRQHPAAIEALRRAVDAQGAWVLAGLGIVVPALGSLVLGLGVAQGRLDAMQAHALSRVDEAFQAELWGEDAEAAARRVRIEADITDAARFMSLVR